jgi:nucleoside-diphosphate-sugar epimerase
MNTAKVIVFGGAGFIGSHLLALLKKEGRYQELHSVDIVQPRFETEGVLYHTFDIRNPIPTDLTGPGPADIYNLAAIHTTPGHEDWEYFWTNVLGAVNVCEYASSVGSEYISFTSSISVYGATELPKDEASKHEPTSAYGRSKWQAERIHAMWQGEKSNSRRVTIVRPAVIYGLGERGNFTRLARLLERGRFVFPGRTDTVKASGYVKDLVRSLLYVSHLNDGIFEYNFAQYQQYSTKEICGAFSSVAGYKEPRIVVPMWLMLSAALCFEGLGHLGLKTGINRARIYKLVNSTNIVPKRLRESGFQFQFDLRSSLRDWDEDSKARGLRSFF